MDKLMIYLIIIVVIGLIVIIAWQITSLNNYKKAINSEGTNKCKTPAGYTDAQWREHMGHHPDRYAECLG